MQISVVIPTLRTDETVLQRAIDSMKGQYDELIVIDDKIENLSRKINKGILQSKGDYIVVCNDDIILQKGTLKDTCLENYVVTPYVNGGVEKLFHAHMWTMPRKVLASVGLMSEEYDGFYYDDSDYWMQIEARGFKIKQLPEVNIIHIHPGRTLNTLRKENREHNNRGLFIKKWGMDNFRRIITVI